MDASFLRENELSLQLSWWSFLLYRRVLQYIRTDRLGSVAEKFGTLPSVKADLTKFMNPSSLPSCRSPNSTISCSTVEIYEQFGETRKVEKYRRKTQFPSEPNIGKSDADVYFFFFSFYFIFFILLDGAWTNALLNTCPLRQLCNKDNTRTAGARLLSSGYDNVSEFAVGLDARTDNLWKALFQFGRESEKRTPLHVHVYPGVSGGLENLKQKRFLIIVVALKTRSTLMASSSFIIIKFAEMTLQ